MSHFAVAVFTDGTKSVDELLSPFDENIEVAPYIDVTKEEMITKAKERKAKYEELLKSGKELDNWMKEYIDASTDEELYKCEWYEDDKYDENGNRLSTYNPKSKWDWYLIGGRWNGLLKAKAGEHGEGGVFSPNRRETGKYDIAKVSDIDFSPNQESYSKALRWWEVVVENSPLRLGESKGDFFNFHKIEYLQKKYKNKETYAMCQSAFSTFAVILPNGEWYEKGSMGWWGAVSNEDDDWALKYKERFIDAANPDWTLTIVDCHI